MDYYEILMVHRKAPLELIKKAYLIQCKEWHPDVHPNKENATAQMKIINEAYEVLSNPQKRSDYDRLRTPYRPVTQQSPTQPKPQPRPQPKPQQRTNSTANDNTDNKYPRATKKCWTCNEIFTLFYKKEDGQYYCGQCGLEYESGFVKHIKNVGVWNYLSKQYKGNYVLLVLYSLTIIIVYNVVTDNIRWKLKDGMFYFFMLVIVIATISSTYHIAKDIFRALRAHSAKE